MVAEEGDCVCVYAPSEIMTKREHTKLFGDGDDLRPMDLEVYGGFVLTADDDSGWASAQCPGKYANSWQGFACTRPQFQIHGRGLHGGHQAPRGPSAAEIRCACAPRLVDARAVHVLSRKRSPSIERVCHSIL